VQVRKIENAFLTAKTDKAKTHGYHAPYSEIFSRVEPKSILEVGVKQGRSLAAWRMLFPNAKISGIDITNRSFESEMIEFANAEIVIEDSTKPNILKHINEKNSLATYDKVLYQIPKHGSKSADLIIVQDLKNSVWNISIDNTTLEFVKAHGLSLYDKILLSVTKKDDPNILYRTLYIDLGMLIEKAVKIPFKFDSEFHGRDVSIYTNKYFDSYAFKVIG
jgi:hypothetical protein